RHAARAGAGPASRAEADPVSAPPGREQRARFEQLPYWIVLAGMAVALATIREGPRHVRGGTFVLAGVLLIAAMARLVLPDHRAGMLSSRRRLWDVATFVLLGVGLLVAGLVLHAPS
ncbi:MAG TPA: DUF3017 domain-containing protein, partial [Streptosporangiaceae bacterium]|nr:DUF3017 domain-containing protein [Streptosporangiaceae bacterium]